MENNTFDVSEQLPFKVPPKTKVIGEIASPKSNGRKLPITELAHPFFLKQFGKLLKDLELPHIHFHDLRHPYVKAMAKNI